jgi:hypothetical protein
LFFREQLAAVSDTGIISYDGVFGRQSFVSAHEAVACICHSAYLSLLSPVEKIPDEQEQEQFYRDHLLRYSEQLNEMDASFLTAGLIWERPRLLSSFSEPVTSEPRNRSGIPTDAQSRTVAEIMGAHPRITRQALRDACMDRGISISNGTLSLLMREFRNSRP